MGNNGSSSSGDPGAETTIVIAGYTSCGYFQQAVATSKAVAKRNPAFAHFKYMGLPDRAEYRKWLASPVAGRPSEPGHTTSPFVYVQDGAFVGGCDDFIEYCRKLGVLQ